MTPTPPLGMEEKQFQNFLLVLNHFEYKSVSTSLLIGSWKSPLDSHSGTRLFRLRLHGEPFLCDWRRRGFVGLTSPALWHSGRSHVFHVLQLQTKRALHPCRQGVWCWSIGQAAAHGFLCQNLFAPRQVRLLSNKKQKTWNFAWNLEILSAGAKRKSDQTSEHYLIPVSRFRANKLTTTTIVDWKIIFSSKIWSHNAAEWDKNYPAPNSHFSQRFME